MDTLKKEDKKKTAELVFLQKLRKGLKPQIINSFEFNSNINEERIALKKKIVQAFYKKELCKGFSEVILALDHKVLLQLYIVGPLDPIYFQVLIKTVKENQLKDLKIFFLETNQRTLVYETIKRLGSLIKEEVKEEVEEVEEVTEEIKEEILKDSFKYNQRSHKDFRRFFKCRAFGFKVIK